VTDKLLIVSTVFWVVAHYTNILDRQRYSKQCRPYGHC